MAPLASDPYKINLEETQPFLGVSRRKHLPQNLMPFSRDPHPATSFTVCLDRGLELNRTEDVR